MANNYLHPGDVLDYTALRAIAAGSLVLMDAIAGIALSDIPAGATGSVRVTGVFALPKATATTAAIGAPAYLDGNGLITAIAAGTPVGVFAAAALDGVATCRIKLNVGATAVTHAN
jgi:predicted RecA/RadA family phage recombinase